MAYKTSVQIEMDASGAIRNLGLLGGQVQRTEKQSVQSLGAIRSAAAGAAGTLATLGVGLGLANAIGTIQQFDASLTKLRAISNATATDMKLLSAQARELGATTVYGANQAAEAQTYLAQAGLRVNDVLGATPAVLQFARAGMLDLGQAADLATDLMAQMGLGVEDLNRISDVLVKSANSATTTVAQLGEAFSYAGPVANSFGLSLEETAAALGQISNAGIKAGRAGTGLLGVLRQLGNVTPQNEELLKQYGLTIADVDVATRGFQPVVDTLAKAGLSAADAFQLFGSEAASAGLALTHGSAAYQQLVTTLGDAGGTAKDTARIMSSDLTSAFKGLQSALDEYVLQLGDSGATGAIKEFITTSTGVVSVLNGMGDQFIEAGGYSEDFASKINSIAEPIIRIGNQWDEFTTSFGDQVAYSRNVIGGFEASFYEAQAAVLQFGANGIDAFASVSEGARKVISDALNPLISAMNYVGLTFANLLDNVGQIPGIGDAAREQAAGIRQGLIEPLELSDSALRSTSENMRGLAHSSLELADNLRSVDFEEQRDALKGYGDYLPTIRSYNENFVSSLEEALAPMDAYIARMAGQGGAGGGKTSIAGSTKEADKAAKALERTLDSAMGTYGKIAAKINPAGAAMDDYRGKVAELSLLLKNGRINQLEYTAAIAGAAGQYNDAVRAADPYYQRIDELAKQYGQTADKSGQLERAASDLHDQFSRGDITAEQYSTRLGNVQDEQEKLRLDSDETAKALAESWEEASERIDETFADAFTGAFDSFEDFGDSLLDGFKRLLGELAYQATLKPIVVNLTGQLGGALGMGGGGGAGGGMNLSSLSSLARNGWDGIQNGFGSINWMGSSPTAYGGTGFANSATSGLSQTGLWGGSTSNFSGWTGLGSAGAGMAGSYVGTELGSSLFGKSPGSNYGAMAGSAIGTYFGGPIGAFAGGSIGGMLDSAFGSGREASATIASGSKDQDWSGNLNRTSPFGTFGITSKSVIGGDVLSDSLIALQSYEQQLAEIMSPDQIDAVTERLAGWSHKSGDVESLIEKRYDQLVDGVKNMADKPLKDMIAKVSEIDDWDFDTRHEAFSAALNLDSIITNLGGNVADYIEEKIENVSGSGFAARAEQVAADVNKYLAVQSAADTLSLNFDAVADGAVYAGRNLVDAAGGLDAFNASISGYYQNFYTEAERTERATEQLNNVIGEFGLSADSTRDQFRDVIESLNLNSSSGRDAYLTLMNVQQSFADLVPWAEEAAAAVSNLMSASERADAKSTYVDMFGPLEFKIAEVRRQLEGAIGSFAQLPTTVEEVRAERNRLSSEQAWQERAVYESNSGLIKNYIDLLAQQEEQLRTTGDALNQYGMTQEQVSASKGTYIDTLAPLDFQISYYRDQLQAAIGDIVEDLPSTLSEAVAQRNQLAAEKQWDERGAYQANSQLISKYIGLLDQQRSTIEQSAQAERDRNAALAGSRLQLEIQLQQALGNTAQATKLQRDMALASTDDTLKALQKQVWAEEDRRKALDEATRAQEQYQQKLDQARSTLASFGNSIQQWIDQLNGTEKGLSSPGDQLAAAGAAYQEQLNLARGGDQNAMSSITQYADRFLEAQKAYSASGGNTASLIDRLERELGSLPEILKPTDLMDDPVAKAIGMQTDALTRVIDQNGDGTISQLELQKAQNEGLLGNAAISAEWTQRIDDKVSKLAHDTWEIRQFTTGAGDRYDGVDYLQRFFKSDFTPRVNVDMSGLIAEIKSLKREVEGIRRERDASADRQRGQLNELIDEQGATTRALKTRVKA